VATDEGKRNSGRPETSWGAKAESYKERDFGGVKKKEREDVQKGKGVFISQKAYTKGCKNRHGSRRWKRGSGIKGCKWDNEERQSVGFVSSSWLTRKKTKTNA